MTRGSIREHIAAVRGRYFGTSKKEKGKILDEFTKVTGCYRVGILSSPHRDNKTQYNC